MARSIKSGNPDYEGIDFETVRCIHTKGRLEVYKHRKCYRIIEIFILIKFIELYTKYQKTYINHFENFSKQNFPSKKALNDLGSRVQNLTKNYQEVSEENDGEGT